MKIVTLFLISLTAITAFAQSDIEQIIRMDTDLNNLILKNDTKAAAFFYAEEFILTTSAGKMKSKTEILDEIGSPDLSLSINATERITVRIMGTTAVLTGILHQKGTYKTNVFDATVRITDT